MSRLACIGISLAAVLCGLPLHALSISVAPPSRADGKLLLYSYPHKEVLEIAYRRADGAVDPQALQQIAHVMRSPDGEEAAIDPQLVALLDQVQDHFGADTVEIISGYRSPAYHRGLRTDGHQVAKESLHMQGTAADIHLDEITEQAVRDYAASLGLGGVGYYPGLHFVHIDLGPVRHWAEPEGPRKMIGREANASPCQATTDRNTYLLVSSGPAMVTISGPPSACALADTLPIRFERFRRGVWQRDGAPATATLKKMPRPCFGVSSATDVCADYVLPISRHATGKYRLHAPADHGAAITSNEYYLKKE